LTDYPTVSIQGCSYRVNCGICNAPVTFRAELDPDSKDVGCASCGNWDSPDQVAAIAFEHAKDEAQLAVNRLARDAARKSKFMTFKGKTVNDKTYRFRVGDIQG